MAELIVDPLEAVEIEKQQAQGLGILAHPLQLPERRRLKARRLGRPVRGSWAASCSSWFCSALNSVMSLPRM